MILFSSLSYAQNNVVDEIDGLLIDLTITRIGHDFYRDYSTYWQFNFPDSNYTISLHERPSARWGSLIWVEYLSKELFRSFLRPNSSGIKGIAESAASQVKGKLDQILLSEAFEDHFDL